MAITLDGDLLLKPEDRKAFYEKLVRDIDEALGKEKDWDPDLHPREPAGSPEGGQFTSGGGDTGADAPSVTYALVADASEAYDRMAGGGGAEIEPSILQDTYDHFLANPSVNLQRMQVSGEPNLFARHLREIGRGSMPQIPEDAEGFKKYTDFLGTKGIKFTYEDIDPRRLIATQNNLDSVTVAGITKYLSEHGGKLKETGGTLVTSKEYAIVDGHHRWGALASYALLHPEEHISVRILHSNADIDTMLAVSREFDRIHGIASEEFGAPMTGAGSRAKEAAPRGLSDAKDGTPEGVYTKEIEQYVRDAKKKPNAILKAVVGLLTALGIKTKGLEAPKLKDWDPELHPRGEGGLFTESAAGDSSHTADVVMVVEGTSKSTREMIAKAVRRAKDYIRPDDKPILVDTMPMKFNPQDLGITQSSDLVSHITLNSMVFDSYLVDPVAVQAELGKSGWTSTGAPDHAVIHELGHALAGGSVAERREQGSWKILYGENQYIGERMAAKVSEYATRSPAEFVAETFAGLVHGQKYDTEVMQAYRTLGGREKVTKAKAWVEKFNEHHDELGRFASSDEGEAIPLSEKQQGQLNAVIAGNVPFFLTADSWRHISSDNPNDERLVGMIEQKIRLDGAIDQKMMDSEIIPNAQGLYGSGALKNAVDTDIANQIASDDAIVKWEGVREAVLRDLVINYQNDRLGFSGQNMLPIDVEAVKQELLDKLPAGKSSDLDYIRQAIVTAPDGVSIRNAMNYLPDDAKDYIRDALQSITPLTDEQRGRIAYETVKTFVDAWAGSSSDSSPYSLAMQYAARDILEGRTNDSFEELMPSGGMPEGTEAVARLIATTIYYNTQKLLEENGVTELALHRGLEFNRQLGGGKVVNDAMREAGLKPTLERGWPPGEEHSKMTYYVGEAEVDMNPLSSFSTDPATALDFAGSATSSSDHGSMVVHTIVPASAIFSVPATGVGCYNENEVVVLNRGMKVTVEAIALTPAGEP